MKNFVALLALIPVFALAEARLYSVEVLVFKQSNSPFATNEQFANNDLPPQRAAYNLGVDAQELEGQLTLAPLNSKALANHAARLNNEGKTVLFHERWLQGLLPEGQDLPIRITGGRDLGGVSGPELQGYLELSIARFIEADLDVAVQFPTGADVFTPRLTETRRARSGEVHYLDHPLIGALIVYERTE